MPSFPWGTSDAPTVFTARRMGDSRTGGHLPLLRGVSLDRVRDLTHENRMDSRVPPEDVLIADFDIRWGWAWLDDKNPVSVGPYVSWMVRQWVKVPPGSLVKAMVAHRVTTELKAMSTPATSLDGSTPAPARRIKMPTERKKEIKEEVTSELRKRQPPKIEEEPFVIDIERGLVLVFTKSESVRQAIMNRLRNLLTPMWGSGLYFEPWNLEQYLRQSRPNTNPPAEPGMKMLTWLAIAAAHKKIIRSRAANVAFRIELDGALTVGMHDGSAKISGDHAVEQAVEGYDDDASGGRVSALGLYVHVYGGRDYRLKVTSDGVITSCKLESATKLNDEYNDADARLQSYVLDRADDYITAAQLVQHMIAAFDVLQLSTWMREQAQVHLPFDADPAGDYELLDEESADLRAKDGNDKKADDARSPRLFDGDTPEERGLASSDLGKTKVSVSVDGGPPVDLGTVDDLKKVAARAGRGRKK